MPNLRTKPDVRFEVITPALIKILTVLERIAQLAKTDITITSGTDGHHMIGSKHYIGHAVDIRSRTLARAQKEVILHELKKRLGDGYDVVDEFNPPHIHIEYDPKPSGADLLPKRA
jgi:hypothetical protein